CMVGMRRDLSRRQLFGLGAGASAALLAACASPTAPTGQSHTTFQPTLNAPDDLEMPDVTVGFVPITCSSPIVNAAALNIYHLYGLFVSLLLYNGWLELWSVFVAGELVSSQFLASMPIAIHYGFASGQRDIRLPFVTIT